MAMIHETVKRHAVKEKVAAYTQQMTLPDDEGMNR